MTASPLRMLMVDDSEEDIHFVRHALKKSGLAEFFHAVYDGEEAVKYLKGEGPFEDRQKFPFPNVVLSDLKMPGMNGFDLLDWLKEHPECGVIPTIVFSSSAEEADVSKAYEMGANAYIVKPHHLDELVSVIGATYQFWSVCAKPLASAEHKCA